MSGPGRVGADNLSRWNDYPHDPTGEPESAPSAEKLVCSEADGPHEIEQTIEASTSHQDPSPSRLPATDSNGQRTTAVLPKPFYGDAGVTSSHDSVYAGGAMLQGRDPS